MDLPEGDERPGFRNPEFFQEGGAVAFDDGPGVVRGEAEVEGVSL